ncbi:reverse transcriptase domain-containing protein [Tanacetum coccineum]
MHIPIRQLAFGTTPESFDEYLQMGTLRTALSRYFVERSGFVSAPEFFKKNTTLAEIQNLVRRTNRIHGIPQECLVALIVSLRDWVNCPKSCTTNIWEKSANNDIIVLHHSPLFDDLLADNEPVAPYVVNGQPFDRGTNYRAEGINTLMSPTFVKSFTLHSDEKIKRLCLTCQESAPERIERAFGVPTKTMAYYAQPSTFFFGQLNKLRRISTRASYCINIDFEKIKRYRYFEAGEIYIQSTSNILKDMGRSDGAILKKQNNLRDKQTHQRIQRRTHLNTPRNLGRSHFSLEVRKTTSTNLRHPWDPNLIYYSSKMASPSEGGGPEIQDDREVTPPPLTKEQIEGHLSALRSIIKDHNRKNRTDPVQLDFNEEDTATKDTRIVKGKEVVDDDLNKPFKEALKTPLTRRIIEFTGPEYKMPTNIKLYDGTTYPEDHLGRFASAVNSGEWHMPVWCRMFQQTLDGLARGWFKRLPANSINE